MTALERQPQFPEFNNDDLLVISQRWAHANRVAVLRCLCLLPNVEVEDDDTSIHLHFFDSDAGLGAPDSDDPFAALNLRGCTVAFASLSTTHLELSSNSWEHAEQVARTIEQTCGLLLRPVSRNVTTVPRKRSSSRGRGTHDVLPPLPAEPAPLLTRPAPPPPLSEEQLAEAVASFLGKSERLGRTLDQLLASTPAFEAAFLVSPTGRPIAGVVPHDCEANVASITVKMLDLGTQAADVLRRGPLAQVIVHGPAGYGILAPVAPGLLLLVRVTDGARLGSVFHDVERLVGLIADSL